MEVGQFVIARYPWPQLDFFPYLQKGYARKLSVQEVDQIYNKTWYLPHFAITNSNKPDKMRVVFEAAVISNGVSLNSMLLKGCTISISDIINWSLRGYQRNVFANVLSLALLIQRDSYGIVATNPAQSTYIYSSKTKTPTNMQNNYQQQ